MRMHSCCYFGLVSALIFGPWQRNVECLAADDEELHVSKPIACKTIDGYRKYTPMEKAALTKDEKLLVYLEVENPTIYLSRQGGLEKRSLHLTQEIRVRRSGERKPIWTKPDLRGLDVQEKSEIGPVYLGVVVGLKGMGPGRYDVDIIVHDKLAKDRSALVTLPFEVLKSADEVPPKPQDPGSV